MNSSTELEIPRDRRDRLARRDILLAAGTIAGGAIIPSPTRYLFAEQPARRPKVAALLTVFTYRSHAHVILENFLVPYLFNGQKTDPGVDVVSMYVDQFPEGDMARGVAKQFDIPIFDTIDNALCVGGKELAVDAVLSIGEHGNYPANDLGQKMYPRKRFFDEAVAVMRRSRRYVPLFNDKHLSYRWDWCREMVDVARKNKIPLMAGSSVPLAERRPPLELPEDAEIEEAVSIHGGGFDSYDFHGLEVVQSMIEGRKGSETGVSSVQFLTGDAVWKAADEEEFNIALVQAAMAVELEKESAKLEDVKRVAGGGLHAILLRHKDGLKSTVLKVGGSGIRWNFACRLKGQTEIHATRFHVGPWNNRNLFRALSHAIQHHFIHGRAPYPVERTLLTSGVCAAAAVSRGQKGKQIATPQLEFAYKPIDFRAMREMGETWKIITDETPQPRGIEPMLNESPQNANSRAHCAASRRQQG